jgi:Domain of unknown function (DUF1874)
VLSGTKAYLGGYVLKVCNAFSLNMVGSFPAMFVFDEITGAQASDLVQAAEANGSLESCVGHADTAVVFGAVLGANIAPARVNVSITAGDGHVVLVGQYSGPRLPEGCKTLPEGSTIKWILVSNLTPKE